VAGVVGAGALVVALAVSGGTGAGAQPASSDPALAPATTTEGAVASPAADAEPEGAAEPRTTTEAKRAKTVKTAKVTITRHGPGTFVRAAVDGPKLGESGRLLRFDVRVEKGLPFDADETAREIEATLADPRSWTGSGEWRLELVSDPSRADFTVFLASPYTVDRYCWPLRTYGRVSCQAGNRVMLNARRWAFGADAYRADVGAYRRYLVNHEIGHRLGHRHVGCPGTGRRAPVMMQQTKSVGACRPNPWPAPQRRG
jgi:hypothetical protein